MTTDTVIRWSFAALSFALSVFGPILAAATIRYVRDKHWVVLSSTEEANLTQGVWRAIGYAEEQAYKMAKLGGSMGSSTKMDLALSVLRAAFPKLDEDVARVRIEAQLGSERTMPVSPQPAPTAQTPLPLT